MRSFGDRRLAIAAGTCLVAVSVWWFARTHWNTLYDDAFIYLRYVRNLGNGCGLRFNCSGEAVEGFTGPLFLALLWLGSLVTNQLIDLCQYVGAVALIGACGFAIATAAALAPRGKDTPAWLAAALAMATALALALDHFVLLNANIGMETSTAALTVAVLGYAVVTERPRLTAVAAVLAMLARPEAVLFVIALPLLPWMRRVRLLVPVAAAVVALVVARLVIFDALAPNTYYAKSGGSLRHIAIGLAYVVDIVRDFPLTVLAITWLVDRKREHVYLLAVAGAWLVFFLRSGGDTFAYSRLWFPLVPTLTAMGIAGAARYRPPIALVLALAITVRAAIAHHIPAQHTNPRVVEWAAIGTYLRQHSPRGTLVATVPIGAIGYYSSLPILDLVGLTDRTIARSGNSVPTELLTKQWIGHERNDTEYVLARKPHWIVTTMIQPQPWTLATARAGFWADWLLLQAIKSGAAPYVVHDAEVQPGRHVLMFEYQGAR